MSVTTHRLNLRALLALHLAPAVPLVALAVWYGLVDPTPLGGGRCASCGVGPSVIAVHLVAAVWLGVVVAAASAVRRAVNGGGVLAPGSRTITGLALCAVLVAASLVWFPLSTIPVMAAMLASFVAVPAAIVYWLFAAITSTLRPPQDRLPRRLTQALTAAWLCLLILLPAEFGWIYSDRVQWSAF
jgi:hypothetical protein